MACHYVVLIHYFLYAWATYISCFCFDGGVWVVKTNWWNIEFYADIFLMTRKLKQNYYASTIASILCFYALLFIFQLKSLILWHNKQHQGVYKSLMGKFCKWTQDCGKQKGIIVVHKYNTYLVASSFMVLILKQNGNHRT